MREPTSLVIGIDARAAAEPVVGRGRVVQEVLLALSEREDPHRYILYSRAVWERELGDRFRWRPMDSSDPWWHLRAARAANRECDVFLSSNSYLTVWFLSIPAVPIVYDLVAFDRSAHPRVRSAVIEWLTMGRAVARASGLIAISQATASSLAARFPAAEKKTVVAPLATASVLAAPSAGAARETGDRPNQDPRLPDPGFVLAVGTLEPRKNLPRMIEAYRRLPERLQHQHPLVVVGQVGWQAGPTLDAVRSLKDRCLALGRVSDADLAELYRRCAVFCYPSLAEGFGLPVLEAMSAGAAVVTSNCSSLPEVGGDAVEYADPYDPRSIAQVLETLLTDPTRRQELGSRARLRAREFSWARTAEIVLGTLINAAQRPAARDAARR